MMNFRRKALALVLSLVLVGGAITITGCGGSSSGDPAAKSGLVDTDIKGDVSIMVWSGDGEYHEDIGHQNLDAKKLTASNVAQIYAVAKKFNETYPNVKINVYAKSGDPNQVGTPSWGQEIENFKSDHGKYPDIWAADNVTTMIEKGLVADLSIYENEDSYKTYNKSLMANLNYKGMQAGLPSFTIPWGIWINKSLATDNNIEVPDPDWTIDEFTDFITQADGKTFWGIKTAVTDGDPVNAAGHSGHGSLDIVNMGAPTINRQIKEKGTVDLNTDAVKSLLKYCSKWAASSIDSAEGAGKISEDIALENKGYSWTYFCNNRTLVNVEDPWYLTAGADDSAKNSGVYINAKDWDFYPFPSTDFEKNTIRLVMDPVCLHNYAQDDGNSQLSKSEKSKLDLAYTFATYWTGSIEARQAIYDQEWTENGQKKASAANDSFPVVTGDTYDAQMEIWNNLPAHQVYKDKEGFQKVIGYFKDGTSWDYADKCWPNIIKENGENKATLYEWIHCGSEEVAGAWATDKNWVDQVKSKLPDWNEAIGKRITKAQVQLNDALKKYYGKK